MSSSNDIFNIYNIYEEFEEDKEDKEDEKDESDKEDRNGINDLHGLLVSIYCYHEHHVISDYELEEYIDTKTSLGQPALNMILEYMLKYDIFKDDPFEWALEHCNDFNLTDNNGNSALHIIAMNMKKIGNDYKNCLASRLITNGANPYLENNYGLSAINIAEKNARKFSISDWNISGCKICYEKMMSGPKVWDYCNECKRPVWMDNEIQI